MPVPVGIIGGVSSLGDRPWNPMALVGHGILISVALLLGCSFVHLYKEVERGCTEEREAHASQPGADSLGERDAPYRNLWRLAPSLNSLIL